MDATIAALALNARAYSPVEQPSAPAQFIVARGPDLGFVYSKIDAQTQEVIWSWPAGLSQTPPSPSPAIAVGVLADITV